MMWWTDRLNPTQRRAIVIALACEVALILAYEVFYVASAQPSGSTRASGQIGPMTCEDAALAPNPIVVENSCPGTSTWQFDLPLGDQQMIQGFTAPASVNAGETVKLYVSTTAPAYQFRVFRMGWYQGLGGRLMHVSPWLTGIVQPPPLIDPSTRTVSAGDWHDPTTMAVPTTWVSGVYVVKLVSSTGYMRYTFFVVRNDASHAAMLFQSSVLTDQAYNTWGGRSLYQDASGSYTQRSYAVSFDRPYVDGAGLSNFPKYEYNLLRWVEEQGYNVTYSTDIDTDQHPSLLFNHRLFIAAGHDEYWTAAMRQNVISARDAGVSLAFFGADDIYWHVRLQPSSLGPDRVVVCYKDASLDPVASTNPSAATVRWRDPPLNAPEDTVLGEMFSQMTTRAAALVLTNDAAPFFHGTALHAGSAFPGLVAQQDLTSEIDSERADSGVPATLKTLASSPVQVNSGDAEDNSGPLVTTTAMATIYTAPSGAHVFDAGTYWWGWGLDNFRFGQSAHPGSLRSADFERFTVNLLSYLKDWSPSKA